MKTSEPGIDKLEGVNGTIYRVQIRKKGYKHQSRCFPTFKAAKKWKYDIIKAQLSGEITDTATMRRTLLSHLIDRYIESALDSSSTNYTTRVGQLEWWKEELGHLIITNITEDLISRALEKRKKTPDKFGRIRTGATINRYSTALSCVLEKACKEWRLIPRNPVRSLKRKPEPRKKKNVLDFEGCQGLLTICQEHRSAYVLPLVSIYLCTGTRKSEVLKLRRKHFSVEREELFFEGTKNGEDRTVPLVRPALDHLKEYLDSFPGGPEDYIFPGRNKDKPIDFRTTWKTVLRRAGIEGFTTHCTRYTTVSLLTELKVPINAIAQIVGHKTLEMTLHYTKLSPKFARASLKDLGDQIS